MYLRYRTKGPSQPASQPVECVRACVFCPFFSHTATTTGDSNTHSTHVVARWHDLSRPGIISVCGQPCPHTPTRRKSGTAQTLMSAPAHTVIERHGAFHATSRAFLWRALGVEEREVGWGRSLSESVVGCMPNEPQTTLISGGRSRSGRGGRLFGRCGWSASGSAEAPQLVSG